MSKPPYPFLPVFLKISVLVFVSVLVLAFVWYNVDFGESIGSGRGVIKVSIIGRFGGSMVVLKLDNESVYKGFIDYNSTVIKSFEVESGDHVLESYFRGVLQERFIVRVREGRTCKLVCTIY